MNQPAGRDRPLQPRCRHADRLRRSAGSRAADRQHELPGDGRPRRTSSRPAPSSLNVAVEAVDPRIQVLDFEPRRIASPSTGSPRRQSRSGGRCGPIPSGPGRRRARRRRRDRHGERAAVDRRARSSRSRPGSRSTPRASTSTSWSTSCRSTRRGSRSAPRRRRPAAGPRPGPRVQRRAFQVAAGEPGRRRHAGGRASRWRRSTVDPPVVSVEGDANDLAGLDRADTEPISVPGASSEVTPDGRACAARWRRRRSAAGPSR